jgi:hypothetical protein
MIHTGVCGLCLRLKLVHGIANVLSGLRHLYGSSRHHKALFPRERVQPQKRILNVRPAQKLLQEPFYFTVRQVKRAKRIDTRVRLALISFVKSARIKST